jgi:hypothetical protein
MYRTALLQWKRKIGTQQSLFVIAVTARHECYSTLNSISSRFPLVNCIPRCTAQPANTLFTPNHRRQLLLLRWSSKKRKNQLQRANAKEDPFAVLNVSRAQTYTAVKSAFLQIAMKHHPDTAAAGTNAEREANKDVFVIARKAFEAIASGPDGFAILKSETEDYVEEVELDQWFKNETGYDMPFMDAATMKEVAEMTESVGGGLDRDGGMWTLARMVADTVKAGGDGRSLLQLEAGTVRDGAIDGILRRKRRR